MIKNQEFTYWERKNGADIALLDITDGKAKNCLSPGRMDWAKV